MYDRGMPVMAAPPPPMPPMMMGPGMMGPGPGMMGPPHGMMMAGPPQMPPGTLMAAGPPPGMMGPGPMNGMMPPMPPMPQGAGMMPMLPAPPAPAPAPAPPVQNLGDKNGKHIPLAKCRVLYLGSSVPLETKVGLEAVQMPLKERYPWNSDGDVSGIDAWLTVFSSGLLLQYVDDKKSVTWFPIQTLHVCAAVKCAVDMDDSGDRSAAFVALDSMGGQQSRHPPLFASIMRRTKGVKVLECHAFIAKSDNAAMALVHSCTHAYEHKEGWTGDMPPNEAYQSTNTHLIAADTYSHKKTNPEFYEKPPPQGYFYSSNKGLVRNYNVFGGKNKASGPPPEERYHEPPPRPQPMPMMPQQDYGGGQIIAVQGPPPGPMMPPQMEGPMMMEGPPPMMGGPPMMAPMAGPPPAGYFNDWDYYGGEPVVVFPEYEGAMPAYDTHHKVLRRSKRSHSRRRHNSPSPRRSRRRSVSPSSYSSESDYYYERRPRTPPADYERHRSRRDDYDYRYYPKETPDYDRFFPGAYKETDDLIMYAPRYMSYFPEEGKRRRSKSRDRRPPSRNGAPSRNGDYDYTTYYNAQGDYGEAPDAGARELIYVEREPRPDYEDNRYREQIMDNYDRPPNRNDFEQTLGYYP